MAGHAGTSVAAPMGRQAAQSSINVVLVSRVADGMRSSVVIEAPRDCASHHASAPLIESAIRVAFRSPSVALRPPARPETLAELRDCRFARRMKSSGLDAVGCWVGGLVLGVGD